MEKFWKYLAFRLGHNNFPNSKKWFVEVDEFDLRERKLLNFGHSFGHALEAASSFEIPHGIGVLLGMKAAIF